MQIEEWMRRTPAESLSYQKPRVKPDIDTYFQEKLAPYEYTVAEYIRLEDENNVPNAGPLNEAQREIHRLQSIWQAAAEHNYTPALHEVSRDLTETEAQLQQAPDRQQYNALHQEIAAWNDALHEETGTIGLKML